MFLTQFLYSQLFVTPRYPTDSFAGKTVIVTGANAGLGFEAAQHIARLDCAKLILAVRTISKGQAAKESIIANTKRTDDCIEVWELDMSSNASIKAFAERAGGLSRLDMVIANAGIMAMKFELADGFESVIQVNVIGTFLLALLLLPKLRATAQNHKSDTYLEIVSSEAHHMANLKEVDTPDLYSVLNDSKRPYDAQGRYNISKALEILFMRELVKNTGTDPIITLVNPGFCKTEFFGRLGLSSILTTVIRGFQAIFARTTEVGSRTLVAGVTTGRESHGEYMADCGNQEPASWVSNSRGVQLQKTVYRQTLDVLEKIQPGISTNI